MVDNEPDTWALESAPPTAAEATEDAAAMRLLHASPGLATRVWELAGGVTGSDGWVRARSRAGGFRIELPGRYDDISHYYADTSIRFANHLVRATVDDVSYSVSREHVYGGAPFRGFGGAPVRDPVTRMRRGWAGNPHTVSLRDVACASGPGFEVQSRRKDGTLGILRAFDAAEGGTYVLAVEGPDDLMTKHHTDVTRFIDSFEPAGSGAPAHAPST